MRFGSRSNEFGTKNMKNMVKRWVARDRDGGLFSFNNMPWRNEVEHIWLDSCIYQDYKYDGNGCYEQLDVTLYPELTWESEPIEIEIEE